MVPLKEVNSLAPRLDNLLISRFVRVMMQVKLCYHLTVLKNPVPREEPHEGDRRLLEEWEEKEVESAELWVRNYTMVEILPSRGCQPLLEAIHRWKDSGSGLVRPLCLKTQRLSR